MSIVAETELEKSVTETEPATTAAAADVSSEATEALTGSDAAGEGELELELEQMEADADRLHKAGVISAEDADMKRTEVAKTRKAFRNLPAEDRKAIIKRRREIGRQIMERKLSGAAVVQAQVRLNHTRLKPLFEQWWPYLNRMSVNMQRFGQRTFADDKVAVNKYFEKEMASIERYVEEALRVAEGFRAQKEAELRQSGGLVFEPTTPMPAMDIQVEVFTPFSMRALAAIGKFDRAMDHYDFMIWNGIRDLSDMDDEAVQFLRKFTPLGVRSYTTHLRLMTTVRGQ